MCVWSGDLSGSEMTRRDSIIFLIDFSADMQQYSHSYVQDLHSNTLSQPHDTAIKQQQHSQQSQQHSAHSQTAHAHSSGTHAAAHVKPRVKQEQDGTAAATSSVSGLSSADRLSVLPDDKKQVKSELFIDSIVALMLQFIKTKIIASPDDYVGTQRYVAAHAAVMLSCCAGHCSQMHFCCCYHVHACVSLSLQVSACTAHR